MAGTPLSTGRSISSASESVVLVHRRDGFRAAPAVGGENEDAVRRSEGFSFLIGQISGFETTEERITEARITSSEDLRGRVPLDHAAGVLWPVASAGPIAEGGLISSAGRYALTRKVRNQYSWIFRVGDINSYRARRSSSCQGSTNPARAAFGATRYIFPERKIHLQYTTTSPKLHKILGVESPTFD